VELINMDDKFVERYVQTYVKQQIDEHEARFSVYGKWWSVLTVVLLLLLIGPLYFKVFIN